MKVLIVASELNPIIKTGGLGDVIGALPYELIQAGIEVRIAIPDYPALNTQQVEYANQPTFSHILTPSGKIDYLVSQVSLRGDSIPIYLFKPNRGLRSEAVYPQPEDKEDDRFLIFTLTVADWLKKSDWQPDVVHCHDWMVAALPLMLTQKKLAIPTLLTIHNLLYQGQINKQFFSELGIEYDGAGTHVNMLMLGIKTATKVNTVSPTYARETLTPEYGCGLDTVLQKRAHDYVGILNGIDYTRYDPQQSPHLTHRYNKTNYSQFKALNKNQLHKQLGFDSHDDRPLYGMVSRLEEQKGLEIIDAALRSTPLLGHGRVVILGVGDKYWERRLRNLAEQHSESLSVINRYDEQLAAQIYAASDFFIMPSKFEPCGLSQLIAIRFGSLPIARKTGGLADTIKDVRDNPEQGYGILFEHYSAKDFSQALGSSLGLYQDKSAMDRAIQRGMVCDFSWQKPAQKYIELYQEIIRYD